MQRTSATHAALILALSPLVSCSPGTALFRNPLSARQLAGMLVALCGVAIVVVRGRNGAWTSAASATC